MAQRPYTVQFNNVSVSAVQDLIDAQPTGSMAIEIHEFVTGQVTQTAVANLRLTLKRLPATVTSGTGGTAVTPQKKNNGDSAATFTARANDATTQASTTGTASVLRGDVNNVINGYQYLPAPEDREQIAPSQAFIVSLDQAPGAAETMSGTLTVTELF